MVRIGIFALQGDVREHERIINHLGYDTVLVRNPIDMETIGALIIPGGESTTFWKLSSRAGLDEPVKKLAKDGLPMFGTCAGLIMMANDIDGYGNQPSWKLLDITVRRNAYGRQLDSRVESLKINGLGMVEVAFIRAPFITRVGQTVEVLSKDTDGNVVFVRSDNLWGAAFHPEITGDITIHKAFCETARRF